MVPQNQSQWLALARSFCLSCCGKSRIGVRECRNDKCVWHECRLEPVQLTFFDKGFRSIFFEDIEKIIKSITGRYTAEDVKAEYHTRFNGEKGPVHKNWYGAAIRTASIRNGARFCGTIKSPSPKRRGGYIGVWEK